MRLVRRGAANRTTGSTKMNEDSSRSHAVLCMRVECTTRVESGLAKIQTAVLYMVDLAGSERIKLSGAEGAAMKEANSINKSLTTLGKVINKVGCTTAAWKAQT